MSYIPWYKMKDIYQLPLQLNLRFIMWLLYKFIHSLVAYNSDLTFNIFFTCMVHIIGECLNHTTEPDIQFQCMFMFFKIQDRMY